MLGLARVPRCLKALSAKRAFAPSAEAGARMLKETASSFQRPALVTWSYTEQYVLKVQLRSHKVATCSITSYWEKPRKNSLNLPGDRTENQHIERVQESNSTMFHQSVDLTDCSILNASSSCQVPDPCIRTVGYSFRLRRHLILSILSLPATDFRSFIVHTSSPSTLYLLDLTWHSLDLPGSQLMFELKGYISLADYLASRLDQHPAPCIP